MFFIISGKFFSQVFLTVVIWAMAMMFFGFTSFYIKRISSSIYEWKGIIPVVSVMFILTLICRVGFGTELPIQPTWSYKMNLDITSKHYGLFGFFPEILYIVIFLGGVLIDFIFWFFLKLGL